MKTLSKFLLAAGTALAVATPLNAATQSTTFQVTATVAAVCSVSANPIPFGPYAGAVIDQDSSLTVNCTSGTNYTVSLNNGANALVAQRRMVSAGQYIPYQIYTDAGRANIWNTTNVASGSGSGANQTIAMYGRAQTGGSATAGNYLDTVTATITY